MGWAEEMLGIDTINGHLRLYYTVNNGLYMVIISYYVWLIIYYMYMYIYILVWLNYNELTASSLEIIVSKGNHPQMAFIQVSEIL